MREQAARKFNLDWQAFEEGHRRNYALYESDKITIDEYLKRTIFYDQRNFTPEEYKNHMLTFSQPIPEMINFIKDLKMQYGFRIAAVSNEGRYAAEYRIKTFDLASFIDDFFISCFVGFQKPDPAIYRMALEVTQTPLENVVYLDDRPNLVEAAEQLGIRGIANTSVEDVREKLLVLLKS